MTQDRKTISISEFQTLIRDMYAERDHARGVDGTFMWLMEEIGELAEALRKGSHEDRLEEFADVLAWTASLANQSDVALNQAIERYASGCPRCRLRPCGCEDC